MDAVHVKVRQAFKLIDYHMVNHAPIHNYHYEVHYSCHFEHDVSQREQTFVCLNFLIKTADQN